MTQSLAEVFSNGYLLSAFMKRDYKVRYAQTFLGYWWSILQPAISLLVLFVVFSRGLKVATQDVPYPVFALSGLIFWNYFNYATTQSASSLIGAQSMLKKIYFPRLMLPLSKGLVGLITPLIGFVLLLLLIFFTYHLEIFGVLLFPFLLISLMFTALGIGIWVSALSIRYRDMQQILPFLLQFLFFLSPVAYGVEFFTKLAGEGTEWLFYLNPLSGIIELFRAIMFDLPFSSYCFMSIAVGLAIFGSSLFYFNRTEKHLADLI